MGEQAASRYSNNPDRPARIRLSAGLRIMQGPGRQAPCDKSNTKHLAQDLAAGADRVAADLALLLADHQANIQRYVTAKALDGLYLMIGEEERKIRRDPIGTGSEILRKVFGG